MGVSRDSEKGDKKGERRAEKAVILGGLAFPVGGTAANFQSESLARSYAAVVGGLVAAGVTIAGSVWYARRRPLRQR